jgi:hypothetical protein
MKNTRFQFKNKISRAAFEKLIITTFGESADISKRCHVEDRRPMTLYYVDGAHLGTWMNLEGWIFTNEIIENHKASMKMVHDALNEK